MKKEDIKKYVSEIKEDELDKTATFTDLVNKREYKKRKKAEAKRLEEENLKKEVKEETSEKVVDEDTSKKEAIEETSEKVVDEDTSKKEAIEEAVDKAIAKETDEKEDNVEFSNDKQEDMVDIQNDESISTIKQDVASLVDNKEDRVVKAVDFTEDKPLCFADDDSIKENNSIFGIVVAVIGTIYLIYYILFNKLDNDIIDVAFITILSLIYGISDSKKYQKNGYIIMGVFIVVYIVYRFLIMSSLINI